MKKILNLIAVTAMLALSVGSFAQGSKMSSNKMQGKSHMTAMSAKPMTMSGMVKGAPTGKTFMLAAKGKAPMMVDASKASVRMKGKFFSIANLKGGSIVSVTGSMMKDHFMASAVDVKSVPGIANTKKAGTAKTTGSKG